MENIFIIDLRDFQVPICLRFNIHNNFCEFFNGLRVVAEKNQLCDLKQFIENLM